MNAGRASLRWLRRPRVPVMLQLADLDCGPACLAMVLAAHGRRTSVADVRARCRIGRDVVTIRTLLEAARQCELDVSVEALKADALAEARLPAIAHWNGVHFVVIERVGRRSIGIVDPALGRRQMSMNEFKAAFSGTLISIQPSTTFRRLPPPPSAWVRYVSLT